MAKKNIHVQVAVASITLFFALTALAQAGSRQLATNSGGESGNTNSASFYTLDADGLLTLQTSVRTGGNGTLGYYASPQVVFRKGSPGCVYVSNAASATISAIVEDTHMRAGSFTGSSGDTCSYLGIGLAVSNRKLYAAFAASSTIATFRFAEGCTLQFVGDIDTFGQVDGIQAYGNLLVVAYANGYIESFDISGTMPVSNGDLQLSTGFSQFGGKPAGVAISSDGHWAIFGDAALASVVEVSDISSGKLSPTIAYQVGTGANSNTVSISRDERFLYIGNTDSAQVTAAFFDKQTGTIGSACISRPSKRAPFTIQTVAKPDGGAFVYVAEALGIGILDRTATEGGCRILEIRGSPIKVPGAVALTSLAIF